MREIPIIRPQYSGRFKCITSDCEDPCCGGWYVPVEQAAYEKYKTVPDGPLRVLLDSAIVRTPPDQAGDPNRGYAFIKWLDSGACPLLTSSGLCRIHAELGEEYLSGACRTYPRFGQTIDGFKEEPLMLSCPEAARLVLLDPKLAAPIMEGGPAIRWDERNSSQKSLRSHFWALRGFAVRLILNRKYELWQRLFLLGVFSRRLAALQRGESKQGVRDVLDGFSAALNEGGLVQSLEAIQPDPGLQLSALLKFLEIGGQAGVGPDPRLLEVLDAFAEGVGVKVGMDPAACVERYQAACRDVFMPFVQEHPYILENYLLNQLFLHRFPVGDISSDPGKPLEIEKGYEQLVIQYALNKGVLIGVAGHVGKQFCADHVVRVVQTITRHFEQNAKFMTDVRALLKEQNMNDARSLAMLVRN